MSLLPRYERRWMSAEKQLLIKLIGNLNFRFCRELYMHFSSLLRRTLMTFRIVSKKLLLSALSTIELKS